MQNLRRTFEFSAETLFKISEIASSDKEWKESLDESFTLSRKHFIVDNLAIYLTDLETQRLDVYYAKAFGRGKSAEADVSWGETIASQVSQQNRIISEKPKNLQNEDRLEEPYILGIPLLPFKNLPGAIVFIRFGGPYFSENAIKYAKYLAQQVNAIMAKRTLGEFAKKLETQSSVSQLQANFINTISHELRNPLGFIKGYTTTLLREDTKWDSATQNDFLKIIERETTHLEELIDNLLDSSRLQSGQMKFDNQLVRLDSLIRDEVSRAMINHPELKVHLDFDSVILPINGDPRRLAQVFDNLINNSIKYAPGAEIFITIHQSRLELVIDYRDSGPDISEKNLPQIFTRFFRDPELSFNVHGSGLGLSICKEIIEHHSGEISVSNPPGWGLAFSIHLPIEPNLNEEVTIGESENEHKNIGG